MFILPNQSTQVIKDLGSKAMVAMFGGYGCHVWIPNIFSNEMYWSKEKLFQLGIKKVMSRDRFQLILSFFHCADNNQQLPKEDLNYNQLQKVRKVCDICIDSWQGAWQLGGEVSVDEMVIGFCGTSSLVNYNPSKLHKWGITVWSLVDPRSGYVYNWDIFCWKKSVPDTHIDPATGRGTVHWVVWDLLEGADVLGKFHLVYIDNYFSSAALFNDLAEVMKLEHVGHCVLTEEGRLR